MRHVRLYDVTTRLVRLVLEREVAPDGVLRWFPDFDEPVVIPGMIAAEAPGSDRFGPISAAVREGLRYLNKTFAEVTQCILDDWEWAFWCGAEPERWSTDWMFLAKAFDLLTASADPEEHRDIFVLIRDVVIPGKVRVAAAPSMLSIPVKQRIANQVIAWKPEWLVCRENKLWQASLRSSKTAEPASPIKSGRNAASPAPAPTSSASIRNPERLALPFRGVASSRARQEMAALVGTSIISKLWNGTYRWEPFPESVNSVIQFIDGTLANVIPVAAQDSDRPYRMACNPDRELNTWLFIAMAFARFTTDPTLTPDQRRDIYEVISVCSQRPDGIELISPPTISSERKRQMAEDMAVWEAAGLPTEYEQYTQAIDEYFGPIKGDRMLTPADFK